METLKTIGKILYGQDNDSDMLLGFDDFEKCSVCNRPLEKPTNYDFKLNRKKYDLSATYDGYWVVSKKFKDFCVENKFEGIDFIQLKRDTNFYIIIVNYVVELNHKRRKTTFEEYCVKCSNYYSIAGSSPNFYKNENTNLENTLYRSDIEYGYGKEQHPILIVNLFIYELIKKQKFEGVYFDNILE